jgi:hypothetical protein
MIIKSYNNHFDEGDNNSDGYNSRSLFFFTELDRDSTNTDLNFNLELKRFYKRFVKNTISIAERLKIDNNVDKNLIFFNFLLNKFL